jgi:hypothetical protein
MGINKDRERSRKRETGRHGKKKRNNNGSNAGGVLSCEGC